MNRKYLLRLLAFALLFGFSIRSVSKFKFESWMERAEDRYFTWEIPWFAYMSNQMILHCTTPVYNPFPHRKLISPGIRFPRIQGLHEDLNLPLEDVFEITPELSRIYVLPTPDYNFTNYNTMIDAYSNPNVHAVRILSKFEDFWASMFVRFKLAGVIGHNSEIARISRLFNYKEPIRTLKMRIMDAHGQKLKRSLAVHIRTFEKSVRLSLKDSCKSTPWYHPLKYIFNCYTVFDQVIDQISTHQSSNDQPIYIASDDAHSRVVRKLKSYFGKRAYFMRDLKDLTKIDYMDTKIPHTAIPAILEHELLIEAEILIGNGWSTYSNTVGARRNWARTYYNYSWKQRLGLVMVVMTILVTALIFLFSAVKYCRRSKMRAIFFMA